MGFARAEIDRAMRAAYFNPDRAVDYLLNGIPESVQAQQRQNEAARANPEGGAGGEGQGAGTGTGTQATSPPPPTGGTTGATTTDEPVNLFEAAAQAGGRGGASAGAGARAAAAGAGAGLAGAPANLDFLRNSPQFQQLRQLVQQQPAMLEPVLQQVADGNPQLAQMIGQNQEQFLQLLSEVRTPAPPIYTVHSTPLTTQLLPNRTSAATASPAWATPAPCPPTRYPSPSPRRNAMPLSGSAASVFPAIRSCRPTLPATRMRSWRPTFCSISRMMMMLEVD
jgi:hypothetical protein